MANKVRWGIMGPGSIARSFAQALKRLPDAELVAVASRSPGKAESFGKELDVPHRHGSYDALVSDPDVDIVYVSTVHPFHKTCAVMCLNAGKAVLCEKPFAMNAAEAREMAECARRNKRFLMEGMWTRFFPIIKDVRERLRRGELGQVRMLHADFGFRAGFDPHSRLFDPALGGGALLDVGVYCTALTFMVLGKPARMTGFSVPGPTAVDEQDSWVFQYPDGALAACSCAVRTNTPQEATIYGTEGYIRIHIPWWHPHKMTVNIQRKAQDYEFPVEGSGFDYEAKGVMDCFRQGKLEDEAMPLDESIAIMETLDSLRKQWGIRYPMER